MYDCQAGTDPCPGQSCDEVNDECLAGPTAQLEADTLTVGDTAVTVDLVNSYVSPVVVCSVQYYNNSIPVVARVDSVTSNSFDVWLENPSGSAVASETVSYLVVEEGTWTIDGVAIEAQTYLSTVTDENGSWVGETQTYNQTYTDPVVLGQVMTANDAWSVFWCQGSARTNPPSSTTLVTGKTVCEDPDTTRSDETIGFIVFEADHGTIGDVEFEALLGTDTVLGVSNSPPYTYTFDSAFASAPTVAVTTMAGVDGANGGWSYTYGASPTTATTIDLVIDEDQLADTERNHINEQVGYVVFETAVAYPSGPECSVPADCDDGLYCNGAEDCVDGSCVAGTAIDCSDGVDCTDDSCNESTDSCDNVTNDANCDNGLYCDGAEVCDSVTGCEAGTAVDCDDGVACTDDSCNETTDSCDNVANDDNCDNGLYCDGDEWCDAASDCQSGTAVDCDDGVGCTDDSCNETTDSCDNVTNDANCDNGAFCDGTETCDATLDCQSGSDPCPGQLCDESTDTCYDCLENADCADGVYCNGEEQCVDGVCEAGTAVDCDDGVGCTDDSCNETTDSCDNIANDNLCDNGDYCDGAETCDAALDCQTGAAVDCDDGVSCTDDSCNESTDSCDNIANDSLCDNGVYCDGAEVCHITLGCQSGTAVDCDDGVSCTDDSCNESTDSCDNVANDANCDNGLWCDGTETCDAVNDCQAGVEPCESGEYCNEETDTCESVECVEDEDCDDDNACTTDTCVDGVCYNECDVTVSSYPYTEGFESGFGDWVNMTGDDMDWTRKSGSTSSSSTGPSAAHGGSYYVYTESSSPNYPSKTALLEGPCFDLANTSEVELTFWYHMYGTSMGTLNVEVSEDCTSWTNVWSLSGNQGNSWYEATVDLTAYVGKTITIRFHGVTGTSYRSDMAVDDITVDVTAAISCTGDAECDDGLFCNGAETCVSNLCQPGSDPCPGQTCDEISDTCVAGPAVKYSWNMDTDPGWTTAGQWAWGQPTGSGGLPMETPTRVAGIPAATYTATTCPAITPTTSPRQT